MDLTNPQTLNRYAYVSNNPLSSTDPSGMGNPWVLMGCGWGKHCSSATIANAQGEGQGVMGWDWGGCTADGISMPCGLLQGILGRAAVQCPNNMCEGFNSRGEARYYWASATGGGYYAYAGPGARYYSNQGAINAASSYYQNASEQDTQDGKRHEYIWKTSEDSNGVFSYGGKGSNWWCGPTDICMSNPNDLPSPSGFLAAGHTHPWPGRGDYQFSQDLDNNYQWGTDYVSVPGGGLFLIQLQVGTMRSTICQLRGNPQFASIGLCQ